MRQFTVAQTARGLATLIVRGDYSLAVQRLRKVEPATKRDDVARALRTELSVGDWTVWSRYWK